MMFHAVMLLPIRSLKDNVPAGIPFTNLGHPTSQRYITLPNNYGTYALPVAFILVSITPPIPDICTHGYLAYLPAQAAHPSATRSKFSKPIIKQ